MADWPACHVTGLPATSHGRLAYLPRAMADWPASCFRMPCRCALLLSHAAPGSSCTLRPAPLARCARLLSHAAPGSSRTLGQGSGR
eukprot:225370-Chlamydomonas_euryale.AAC.1